eukprot:TRINITY_DN5115_c0_g1_i1.p1 TRINITY_DN5115_c0_g1~~TRINITY_DN5115_c0_g1_i1.p1  ORF type:complete len:708 (-),score=66.73 TRINITY_DN5115_c0_g1_i1:32-2155(-)
MENLLSNVLRGVLLFISWGLVVPILISLVFHYIFQELIEVSILRHVSVGLLILTICIVCCLSAMYLYDFLRNMRFMMTIEDDMREDHVNVENTFFGLRNEFFSFLDLDLDDEPHERNQIGFSEMIGLKGPLVNLFWKVLVAVFVSAILLGIVVLLPLFTGRLFNTFGRNLIQSDMESWTKSTNLIVGYMFLFSVASVYIFILSKYKEQRELDETESSIAGVLLFCYIFGKVSIFSIADFIVFPLFCGYLVKHFSGMTLRPTEYINIADSYPNMHRLLLWLIGLFYMILFSCLIRCIRKNSRKGILWFLRDPDNPDFSPVSEMINKSAIRQLWRVVLTTLIYFASTFLLIKIPSILVRTFYPSIVPLRLTVYPMIEISIDMMIIHILVPFTAKLFNPATLINNVMKKWLILCGKLFSLSSYLFGEDDQETNDSTEERDENMYSIPNFFAFRIASMLVLSWIFLVFILINVFSLPILLGRYVLDNFITCADFYTFVLGAYIIGFVVYSTMNLLEKTIPINNMGDIAIDALKSSAKIGLFCLFWFGAIPLLAGKWFLYVVDVPLSCGYNQSVNHIFIYDFILGFINLQIWHRLVMIEGISEKWKQKFDLVLANGFWNFDLLYPMKEIVWPVANFFLLRLCVPYFCAKIIIPNLVVGIYHQQIFERLVFPAFSVMLESVSVFNFVKRGFFSLHKNIRDKKYLVGRTLLNRE